MALKKRTKWFIIGGVAVVVAAAIVGSIVGGNGDEATIVQAEIAYLDDIHEIVTASGRVQPQTKVDIVSEVSAQVVRLHVAEGDMVDAGEPLLLLDTIQLKADRAQARYSLDEIMARTDASRSVHERDKLAYERQSRLYDQKLTSEIEYTNAKFAFETSRANYEAMLAQVKTQQARLDKAEDNLDKTLITAPMSGVVTYLNVEEGEIAQAQTAFTQGKTLMVVSDLSAFEVNVDVDETEIAKLRLGQLSEIRLDAFRDSTFDGAIVEIGNSARVQGEGSEDYTTNFLVKVKFVEANSLIRPGMSATVDITSATEENALLVPYASVVTREFDVDSVDFLLYSEPSEVAAGNGVLAAEADDQDVVDIEPPDSSGSESTVTRKRGKDDKVKLSGVFVVRGGVARFVEVQTGIADDRNIVALTGAKVNDTVVSGSYQTLRELEIGDAVQLDEQSKERIGDEG
jgi:HlyD family secretion protein